MPWNFLLVIIETLWLDLHDSHYYYFGYFIILLLLLNNNNNNNATIIIILLLIIYYSASAAYCNIICNLHKSRQIYILSNYKHLQINFIIKIVCYTLWPRNSLLWLR